MARAFLTAEWRHLVMLNYVIDPAVLAPSLPAGVELDLWQDRCYVSIVGFMMLDTRVLGLPIPGHREFEEVNLRFYVVRTVDGERRRGVVFIKEVVRRRAIAWVARAVYNEKYERWPMSHEIRPGRVVYRWAGCEVGATMTGAPRPLEPGSEAEFIAEHYWGYSRQRDGGTVEYRVEHPPWRHWPVESHWLSGDVAGFYGPEFGAALAAGPRSAFVAEGSAVQVFPGQRLRG